MLEVLLNVSVGIIGLGIGYLTAKRQGEAFRRQLMEAAEEISRQFDIISLTDEYYMTHILANCIREESFVPDLIVAIAPGGSMIGEWLSRRFLGDSTNPIPMCTLWIDVERDSKGKHISNPKIQPILTPSLSPDTKRVLIVNDTSRTGHTLGAATEFVEKEFPKCKVKKAVLFWSVEARLPDPDFWVDRPSRRIAFSWKEART